MNLTDSLPMPQVRRFTYTSELRPNTPYVVGYQGPEASDDAPLVYLTLQHEQAELISPQLFEAMLPFHEKRNFQLPQTSQNAFRALTIVFAEERLIR